jgi:TonB family protein
MQSSFANTLLLIIFLIGSAPHLQDTLTMPTDPAAILAAAAKVNGLSGPVPRPWHLRVSYQIFDDRGRSKDSGVYEELWVSDKKYKRSYASSSFTQTDFATNRGLYRSGNHSWPGPQEIMLRTELFDPIPSALNLSGFRLESKHRSVDKVKFQCITLKGDWIFSYNDAYCFQPDKPILRFTSAAGGSSATSYDDIFMFQGHFLARNIRVMNAGKPRLVLHIDSIEEETTVNDSDLTPPPDAVLIPAGKVAIPEKTMTVLLLRQVTPHYPANARSAHIAGIVVLQITIGKDGHVTRAQAISGPSELWKASTDAVLNWEYRPFLIAGEPTEVETTSPIIFTLEG